MGQPGDAAKPIKHFHAHLHGRGSLPTDAQENREELRIRQGIGALRQEPLARPFAYRPMGNAVPDRLSAHLDSP
jgi:hypothetical protein